MSSTHSLNLALKRMISERKNSDFPGPLPSLSPSTPALEIKNLSFFYGKKQSLQDISFPLYANKITAIIGPSGCGKSTLLRAINRIYDLYPEQKAQGDIQFNNKNILNSQTEVAWLRKNIGMVFQKPTPFPMSIFDNVAYGIRLYDRLSPAALKARVEKALFDAALWDEVKDQLHESGQRLSGGQQQRLCIARALAVEPEVLLLDEPTSALDPIATAKIETLLAKLKSRYTIAIVTHNLQQAARLSDYAAFLFMGKLVEFDVAWKIFESPAQAQTTDYIEGRFG